MMPDWEKLDFYKIEIEKAETERKVLRKKLIALVEPKKAIELNRNDARAQVIKDVERAWKLVKKTEDLNLIVLDADERKRVFKSELLKIFPEGAAHLPEELKSLTIYPTVKNGTQKVQYIGKVEELANSEVNENKLVKGERENLAETSRLFERVRGILDAARAQVARSINSEMVEAYWRIGGAIVEQEQKGSERANYGDSLIEDLSKRLRAAKLKGFDKSNLWHMRNFYLKFPNFLDAARRELS